MAYNIVKSIYFFCGNTRAISRGYFVILFCNFLRSPSALRYLFSYPFRASILSLESRSSPACFPIGSLCLFLLFVAGIPAKSSCIGVVLLLHRVWISR